MGGDRNRTDETTPIQFALVEAAVTSDRVSWAELRRTLAAGICQLGDPHIFPGGETCSESVGGGVIDESSKTALRYLLPLLESAVVVEANATRDRQAAQPTRAGQEALQALLEDPAFVALLLPRVLGLLGETGVQCIDCPVVPYRVPRSVTWTELSGHLTQYVSVSVDSVRKPEAQRAQVAYSFRVCSTPNPNAATPADTFLSTIGFLAVRDMTPLVAEALDSTLSSGPQMMGIEDTEHGALLSRLVAERLVVDKRVLSRTCEVLKRYSLELGATMLECAETYGGGSH
jgi:hypothetical protein